MRMEPRQTEQVAGGRQIDVWLLAMTLLLVCFGLVMVLSSSAFFAAKRIDEPLFFFKRQCMFAGGGLLVLYAASRFNYQNYRKLTYPLLALTALLLALVLVPSLGDQALGARRWLPIGPFHIQPSEFAKVILVLYMAFSLTKPKRQTEGFMANTFHHLLMPLLVLGLIVAEPDFGTVFLILGVSLLMLFVSGSPLRYLVGLPLMALPVLIVLFTIFPHSLFRLRAFMNQLAFLGSQGDYSLLCYQVRESIISFGSGRLWGMGLGEGTLKMFFLPQAHSDFVLATLGQELGFMGTSFLLILFAVLVFRGYQIAWRVPDRFGSLLAFGLTTLVMAQFLMNVGVVTAVLPPKGIALPFISYGGSALITTLFAIGILLNISRHTVSFVNPRRGGAR